ncbi:MAG: glycosyltransferase family 2 protein [Euryarchaeota archaeon]|nr:glycosyltransferase family 2 protein [Euryarchaeota archaeon]
MIIPAYNEKQAIGDILKRTHRVFQKLNHSFEIIVIDDGSNDGTSEIIRPYSENNSTILLQNQINLGKGHSLRKGFKNARGKFIVTIDADGSHQPEEIPKLLQPLLENKAELVIGSRFMGEIESGAIPKLNIIGNKLFNVLTFILRGRYLTDIMSGFRAMKNETLQLFNLDSKGYEIESEMTVEAIREGIKLHEVPITCTKSVRASKLRSFKDGYVILKTIVRTALS